MRFFFEFVSCCTRPVNSSTAITTSAVKPAEERLVQLNAVSAPVDSRRKLSRRATSRSGSTGDWRPALNVISEDHVTVERENHRGSETITKKRKIVQSNRKVEVRRNYGHDDCRRSPFGAAMAPAFAPTPFFF